MDLTRGGTIWGEGVLGVDYRLYRYYRGGVDGWNLYVKKTLG